MVGNERQRGHVAVTGAAGSLASDIIPGLLELGYRVAGVDQREPESHLGCAWVSCSIFDSDQLSRVFAGCDAVVHLAGIPLEADWSSVSRVNIDGTQAVLEAAQSAGVRRAVLASSIHSVGFVPIPQENGKVHDDVAVRPDTFYGVSKAAVEALGSLYHDRYGMDVVCLRIASRFAHPEGERMLSTWLSPADAVRLFDAALTAESPGFRTVWGVSANKRSYLSPAGGRAIGFYPQDDAEEFALDLFARSVTDPQLLGSEWDKRVIGGVFCSPTPPMFLPWAGPVHPGMAEPSRLSGMWKER